jgi:hypothetical protein
MINHLLMLGVLLLSTASLASAGPLQRIAQAGLHDFRGQVLVCQPEAPTLLRGFAQRVGLHIAADNVHVQHVTVRGCDTGVQATGQGTTVANVTVQQVNIGFEIGGTDNEVTDNLAGDATIGFWVSGQHNHLARNVSNNNTGSGYLITGFGNLLEDNEALNNGRAGFYNASSGPVIETNRVLLSLRRKGQGNQYLNNLATGNGLDLAEDPRENSCPSEDNLWTGNVFGTANIPAPCPPEPE